MVIQNLDLQNYTDISMNFRNKLLEGNMFLFKILKTCFKIEIKNCPTICCLFNNDSIFSFSPPSFDAGWFFQWQKRRTIIDDDSYVCFVSDCFALSSCAENSKIIKLDFLKAASRALEGSKVITFLFYFHWMLLIHFMQQSEFYPW